MFKQMITKTLLKGGEYKMKTLKIAIVLAFVLGLAYPCFAAQSSGAITVQAVIPSLTQALGVTITPVDPRTIDPDDDVWDGTTVANMSGFGGLTQDTVNKIWKAGRYYAVDISVTDNSGNSWYLNHSVTSIRRGTSTDTLDSKVNVAMYKLTKDPITGEETDALIQNRTFGTSAVTSTTLLNKAALSGGWLRIYYGLATGNSMTDASGATPVGLDQTAGTYTGSVTITLSP